MTKFSLFSWPYQNILKPIFFKFDPEFVHDLISRIGRLLGSNPITRFLTRIFFSYQNPMLQQTVAGLEFVNPVGLSAGFDKNARLINILPEVGFGFMELGSITWKPHAGNPKPRLKRLPKSKGLVVYYGLMNDGVNKIVPRIKKSKPKQALVGISVAKTNSTDTSTEQGGIQDYYECLKHLKASNVGDYYTINISCPNTFGGEPFTTVEKLTRLLTRIQDLKLTKPVFVKMPINLSVGEFDSLLDVCLNFRITGVVIGNLNKQRTPELIEDELPDSVKGGISGKPTWELSNELISHTYQKYGNKLVIIGVGGIFSAADAYEKIKRGATLVQLLTGMIFEGPQLIGQINQGIVELLQNDGYTNISQAIGKLNS